GVGLRTAAALLTTWSPPDLIRRVQEGGEPRFGENPEHARAIQTLSDPALQQKAAGECARHRDAGRSFCVPTDALYPEAFRALPDPPMVLFFRGASASDRESLAVVGTRMPTPSGVRNTRRFVSVIAGRGITIVSGLARGIDTVAHQAALDAGGRTVAVLGSGLERIYPKENYRIAERITENGMLYSEFDPDQEALPHCFPMRNRLISALSQAVLVMEAPKKSGALITADLALEQSKDVFAVPGNILTPQAQGPNRLIQEGAFCATSPEDILEGMRWGTAAGQPVTTREALKPEWEKVLAALRDSESATLEDLAAVLPLEPGEVMSSLSALEVRGYITSASGRRWLKN
ncbi:MAG: DNA-protecting protein DprA, partial [Candidatus Omnitrophica bacterium]|nr:DNA-protecting protein DprA [Candidatus Omnitrophota bacterium]